VQIARSLEVLKRARGMATGIEHGRAPGLERWAAYSKATWATRPRRERVLGAGAGAGNGDEPAAGLLSSTGASHGAVELASAEARRNRYRLCCSNLDDLVSLIGGLVLAARPAESGRVRGLRPA
jgi:hypothetical protein